MSWDRPQTDKLDLQTVLYKVLMDLIDTAGRINMAPEMGENFYAQVRTLRGIVRPLLSDEALQDIRDVIKKAQDRWTDRGEDKDDPLSYAAALQDKGRHTFFCAVRQLEVVMVRLNEKGIIRLQKKSGITGWGLLDEKTGKVRISLTDVAYLPTDGDDEGE